MAKKSKKKEDETKKVVKKCDNPNEVVANCDHPDEVIANCDNLRSLKFYPSLPYAYTECTTETLMCSCRKEKE